jgi:hypothetical protein
MNQHSFDSPASLLVLAAIFLASSGCAVQTIGGVEPGGSDATVTAVALLGSQMPQDSTGYLSQLAQIDVQPDSLYVFIGNFDEQCKSPFPPVCEDAAPTDATVLQWQVIVGIPASLQQEGVLTLPDEAGVDSVASVGGTGPSSASTCGSGPKGLKGDVAIASIDATQVTLDFMGVQPQIYAPEGPPPVMTADYKAPRCP